MKTYVLAFLGVVVGRTWAIPWESAEPANHPRKRERWIEGYKDSNAFKTVLDRMWKHVLYARVKERALDRMRMDKSVSVRIP